MSEIKMWRKIDWRTYMRSDSSVAVALHFNGRDWFITTVNGGEVAGEYFSSATEAMSYADVIFQGCFQG